MALAEDLVPMALAEVQDLMARAEDLVPMALAEDLVLVLMDQAEAVLIPLEQIIIMEMAASTETASTEMASMAMEFMEMVSTEMVARVVVANNLEASNPPEVQPSLREDHPRVFPLVADPLPDPAVAFRADLPHQAADHLVSPAAVAD